MNTKFAITLGAIALSTMSGAAYAGSLTQPGETVGIAIGAPLPEGVYFVDTGSYGSFRVLGDSSDALVNIPVLAWSTPWTFLGGRIEAYTAAPEVAVGRTPPNTAFISAIYNPALLVGEAWSLGNGWNFSSWVGGYAPVDNELGQDYWTFNYRGAVTYNADNWDLTAHVIYGIRGDNLAGGPLHNVKVAPDYVNLDLTATKTLGKWEVGVVGFGSWDVSGTFDPLYQKQSQFAVGGLVGYNFTGISLQAYLTRDVFTDNYFNADGSKAYETRFWTRLVIPLWSPPAEPVLTTYKK
jgi:hypothetical protein